MRRIVSLPIFCGLVIATMHSAHGDQTWKKQLAHGVTLTQQVLDSKEPQVINAVRVDPKSPGVSVKAVLSRDVVLTDDPARGNETMSMLAKRMNAAVVVNADFFPIGTDIPGDPLNLMVMNGELVSEPSERVVFGMTADGKVLFDRLQFEGKLICGDGKWFPIRGINRKRAANELVVFTPRFGASTHMISDGAEAVVKCDQLPIRIGRTVTGIVSEIRSGAGDTPLPEGVFVLSGAGTGARFINDNLKPGTTVSIRFDVISSFTGRWDQVHEAVGGCPWLVKDGKVFMDGKDEGSGPSFYAARHPRTAAGVTKDGNLVLVTVDGRQSIGSGMTLDQLAKVMISQGCVQAVNLDGGGSTTMATSFGVLNSPSGGIERQVANGVAIFAKPLPSTSECDFAISAPCPVLSGTTIQLSLLDTTTGRPLNPAVVKQAIWSVTAGAGFVDQSGKFYGIKARKGAVNVRLGSKTASVPIETVAGEPTDLSVSIKPDESGAPNRGMIVLSATDVNSNSVVGKDVVVKVSGGVPDEKVLLTGEDGKASTGVTWDGAGGSVEVTCGGVKDTAKR